MTRKTILIVGPGGPQGKSTLKRALQEKGYIAIELEDIFYCNIYSAPFNILFKAFYNGIGEGFIVINFTGAPFIENRKADYKMPENEVQQYIDFIDELDKKVSPDYNINQFEIAARMFDTPIIQESAVVHINEGD